MIPGDLLSAFLHRQFHTLPGLLDSWAALPNSYPKALRAMQGGNLYHFYDGLWYDPTGRRTLDLPCERRTRYRLSQPDTVARSSKAYKPGNDHSYHDENEFLQLTAKYWLRLMNTTSMYRIFYVKLVQHCILKKTLKI